MLPNGVIYIGISSVYLILFSIIIVKASFKAKQNVKDKKNFEETNGNSQLSSRGIFESSQIMDTTLSYKRKDLAIEIPDEETSGSKRPHPIRNYFQKNCFPLSLNFQISSGLKIQKLSKWFLSLCLSFTLSLILIENLVFLNARADYFILIPLTSSAISSVFSGVLEIIFMLEFKLEKKWAKNLIILCRYFIYASVWVTGLITHLWIEVRIM